MEVLLWWKSVFLLSVAVTLPPVLEYAQLNSTGAEPKNVVIYEGHIASTSIASTSERVLT